MSEYIVEVPEWVIDANGNPPFGKSEEIVRCRDCEYYEAVPEDGGDWCGYWTEWIYADARGSGFCAWAERQEP